MLVHPGFDPIFLKLGPVAIHWYGVMYLVAFVAAFLLGRYRMKKQPWLTLETKEFDDILFYGVLGVIVGGRLGYVLFYKPLDYINNPLQIFYVWEGGMSFHGGLIGVLIAVAIFCFNRNKNWLTLMDFIAPLIPTGLAAGRLGNFINSELWGRATDLPVGMVFPLVDNVSRHPSQLYEFFLEGVVLFIIIWWASSVRRPVGVISALFLMVYGILRFLVEYAREPDQYLGFLLMGLTMGQILCIPMMIAGLIMFFWAYRRR